MSKKRDSKSKNKNRRKVIQKLEKKVDRISKNKIGINFLLILLLLIIGSLIGTLLALKYIVPFFASKNFIFNEKDGSYDGCVQTIIEKKEDVVITNDDAMSVVLDQIRPSLAELYLYTEGDDGTVSNKSLITGVVLTSDGLLGFKKNDLDLNLYNKLKVKVGNKIVELKKEDVYQDKITDLIFINTKLDNLTSVVYADNGSNELSTFIEGQKLWLIHMNPQTTQLEAYATSLSNINYLMTDSEGLLNAGTFNQFYQIEPVIWAEDHHGVVINQTGEFVGFYGSSLIDYVFRAKDIRTIFESYIQGDRMMQVNFGIKYEPIVGEWDSILEQEAGGLLVKEVIPESIAADLGLVEGDIITAINDQEVITDGYITNQVLVRLLSLSEEEISDKKILTKSDFQIRIIRSGEAKSL